MPGLDPMKDIFHKLAAGASRMVGSAYAFIAAIALIVGWLTTGPAFGYSDTWQLIINTTTTIVTFLMVFLIQNTQNRDSLGLHLKLDELIRATKGARNSMIDLAKLTDQQLIELEREFERICAQGLDPDEAADAAASEPACVAEPAAQLELRRRGGRAADGVPLPADPAEHAEAEHLEAARGERQVHREPRGAADGAARAGRA
jgi:low affinity Fe/Cu permease